MQYIFLSVCIVVFLGMLIGIPTYCFWDAYKNRKYCDGNWVYMMKINRAGTHIQPVLRRIDRNVIHDTKIVDAGNGKTEKKTFTYFLQAGYSWLTSYPHFRRRFYQGEIPMVFYVDGYNKPIDLLAALRETLKMDAPPSLQEAYITQAIHNQRATEAAFKAVTEPLGEGNWFKPWMFWVPTCLILVGLIVIGILIMKSGGGDEQVVQGLNDIKNLLDGVTSNGGVPPTP